MVGTDRRSAQGPGAQVVGPEVVVEHGEPQGADAEGRNGAADPLRNGVRGEVAGVTETTDVIEEATAVDRAQRAGEAAAAAAVAAGEPPPSDAADVDLTAAAFFDVDNTMMVGASIFHFARGLAARKFFTTSDLAGFAWQQIKFRLGGREDSNGIAGHRDT